MLSLKILPCELAFNLDLSNMTRSRRSSGQTIENRPASIPLNGNFPVDQG